MNDEMIYSSDIGGVVEFTVKENGATKDISAATTVELKFALGTTSVIKTGTFKTDGTDGIITYTLAAGDLSAGTWQVKARVTFSPTSVFGSDSGTLKVMTW